MNIRELLVVPENRKGAAAALAGVIALFLIVLVVRSCRRPDAETAAGYLERLGDPVAERRMDAVLGLARLEISSALPRVNELLLADPDERVRRAAAYAVLVLDRPAFLKLLASDREEIRLLAIETIARLERERAAPQLEAGLRDESLRVRQASLELLARFAGRRAHRVILQTAENSDEDPALRVAAIMILARSAEAGLAENMRRLAREERETRVRQAAVEAVRIMEERARGNQAHPGR